MSCISTVNIFIIFPLLLFSLVNNIINKVSPYMIKTFSFSTFLHGPTADGPPPVHNKLSNLDFTTNNAPAPTMHCQLPTTTTTTTTTLLPHSYDCNYDYAPAPHPSEARQTNDIDRTLTTRPVTGLPPLILPHQCESNSPLPPIRPCCKTLAQAFPDHFADCHTLPQTIERSDSLAIFGLDMAAAIRTVLESPRSIDLDMIIADTAKVNEIGLTALFALTSDRLSPYSLKSNSQLFIARYPGVSTNPSLARLDVEGLTTEGGPDFVPNNGVDPPHYPPSVADDRVICYNLAKGHKSGKYIILPADVFAAAAAKENLSFHVSPAFIVKKRETTTGRLVIDYSNSGPNFEAKPVQLATVLGPIKPPQYADVCRLLINAKLLFPGQEIYALRRDVDGAYNRLLYNLKSALLCAFNVSAGGQKFTAIPISCMFGDQQVNFEFDQVSRAIAEVIAVRAHELTLSTLPLTTVCTDDIIAIGSGAFIDAISQFIGETVGTGSMAGLLGLDAIALAKDLRGTFIEILGWMFDCQSETLAPNAFTTAKLINIFYSSVGQTPYPGQPIPLAQLQRMSAHAIRAADVVTAMLPFSRSFAAATVGVKPHTNAYLTRTNVHDIMQWRAILSLAVDDVNVLTSPVYAPDIKKRLSPEETDAQRDQRAAAHATLIAYSDAATGTALDGAPMLGGFIPDHAWFHLTLPPEANSVTDLRQNERRSDINVHEFTALILTAILGVQIITSSPQYLNKNRHLHIWCDNTSAVFRARSNRSHLPIYSLLLTILAYIQVKYQCFITVGHIKGALNIFGDATSRNFQVPRGDEIRQMLSTLGQWRPSSDLVKLILDGCSSSKAIDWSTAVKQIISPELTTLNNIC
jgi:hypothetical protein